MNSLNFEGELFGGKIQIVVYSPEKNTGDILKEMYTEALRLQKIFNFFDEKSELSLLNKKRQMKVSQNLLMVIKKAIEFAKLTKGRYDPSLGKRILERKLGKEETETGCSYKDIKISLNKITLKDPDIMLDLGSIAKGYITDKLSEFLKKKGVGEFIINSRGDITFSGSIEHIIGIKNPRKELEAIEKIKMKNASVATSGDYNQFYGNFKKSHILNSGDTISITVVSDKLEDADVLATSLFVSTREEAKKIAKKFKKSKILIIREDLRKEYYNKFENILEK